MTALIEINRFDLHFGTSGVVLVLPMCLASMQALNKRAQYTCFQCIQILLFSEVL